MCMFFILRARQGVFLNPGYVIELRYNVLF